MKFGSKEVIDLLVFDENEKLVVKLDTLRDSEIFFNDDKYFVGVTDATFNFDLQKFLQEEDELTDFQLATKGFRKTLRIKKPSIKKCKLVGNTIVRYVADQTDTPVTFECHNAEINDTFQFKFSNEKPAEFDYVFELKLDGDGDFIKFNIK